MSSLSVLSVGSVIDALWPQRLLLFYETHHKWHSPDELSHAARAPVNKREMGIIGRLLYAVLLLVPCVAPDRQHIKIGCIQNCHEPVLKSKKCILGPTASSMQACLLHF